MEITRTRRLAHPAAAVTAMLLDPEAHVDTYRFMGHRDIRLVRAEEGLGTLDLEIVRRVDVEVPAAAKRFVRPSNTVTSSDHWQRRPDGGCEGRSDVHIAGLPVSSVGTAEVIPDTDDSCHYRITLAMTIAVPVVGERAAKAMRGQLERQIDAQLDAAEAWLEGRV